MADNIEDKFSSPFDGLISLAPVGRCCCNRVIYYMLFRSTAYIQSVKNIKHEFSTDDIRFMKIQSTLNIVFSAVFMACGVMLIVYFQ